MYKKTRIVMMIIGLTAMGCVSFLFGFTESGLPGYVYMILWICCLILVRYSCRGTNPPEKMA